ncbi:MAG: STAS domain-containing protein [Spirochaetales bacterium]|nr:STAS domain-containing protein [Spirochaetales bacterium]
MMISTQQLEDSAVVTIEGNIDSESGHDLSVALMKVMEWEDVQHVDFDLATVNTVTSAAIGKLINFYKFMEQKCGTMSISAISEGLRKQFREIHLDRIIPIK